MIGKYSFKRKNERPWPNERLGLAVIIGHTTPTKSRIWVRTDEQPELELLIFDRKQEHNNSPLGELFGELRLQEGLTEDNIKPLRHNGKKLSLSATGDTDTTSVIDVQDLAPGKEYSYAIWSAKEQAFVLGHDKRRRFKTPKLEGNFAFGLFSCHQPYEYDSDEDLDLKTGISKVAKLQNMRLWDTARMAFNKPGRDLDFVIAGGDQAYCDGCDGLNIWDYLKKIIEKHDKDKQKYPLPEYEDMLSWYREMYRGYWGHMSVRAIFSQFPTYMIWDDHEIRDGWGSYKLDDKVNDKKDLELKQILFEKCENYLSYDDCIKVLNDMFKAAKQAYFEYEHSHNPVTDKGVFDYGFTHKNCAFYVLDGRGHRDFDREANKILGVEQIKRFKQWLEALNDDAKFLFVVSAVPLVHTEGFVEWAGKFLSSIEDDLRDSWAHKVHEAERGKLLDLLFAQADKRQVSILSGDVHLSAAFRIKRDNKILYQLTSSPITYNLSKFEAIILRGGLADDGEIDKNTFFERIAYLNEPSFAIIKVDSQVDKKDKVTFQLYKEQSLEYKEDNKRANAGRIPAINSLVKIELDFDPEK